MPDPGKSYLVYTAEVVSGQPGIWYRELTADDILLGTRPNPGDEVRIDAFPRQIRAFYCIALTTPGHVLFLYEDADDNIYQLTQNFGTNILVSPASLAFEGRRPALDFDTIVRSFYLRQGNVNLRNDFGEELVLVQPSERDIRDMDVRLKDGESVARYAGSHFLQDSLALKFKADVNSLVVYKGDVGPTGLTAEFPDIINPGSNHAIIQDQAEFILNAAMPGGGLQGDGVRFQGNTGRLNAFGSFFPANLDEITIMLWLYGDTDLPQQTSFFRGLTNLNAHIPWTDQNVYWDVYQNAVPLGGTLDRTNFNAGTTTEGAWRHWAFTHNTNTGNHRIYRDGVQQIAATSKFNTVLAASNLTLINRYSGWCSEIAICDEELTQPEIDAARTLGLAGTPLSLASVPELIHYWPMNQNPANGLLDSSGNDAHTPLSSQFLVTPQGVVWLYQNASMPIGSFTVPAAMTLEAWVQISNESRESRIFYNDIDLVIINRRRIVFQFDGANVVWQGEFNVPVNERIHVAVSHTFGAGAGTFVTINGQLVQGDWVTGTGDETPVLSGDLVCQLGKRDTLEQMRISDVARPLSEIRDYIGGRI